jgi:hypothetical protein
MNPKLYYSLILFLISLTPIASHAEQIKIGVLSSKHCEVDDYNSHIFSSPLNSSGEGKCIFTFLKRSKEGKELEYETEAKMNINGMLIFLVRKDEANPFEFISRDGAVNVQLNVHETGTSCVEGEDKCCGSDYSGTLTVKTAAGKSSIKIEYYRGG